MKVFLQIGIDWRRRQNLHRDAIAVHLRQVALEIPGREGRFGPTRHHRSCPCRLFYLDFRGIARGELSQIGLREAVCMYVDIVHEGLPSDRNRLEAPTKSPPRRHRGPSPPGGARDPRPGGALWTNASPSELSLPPLLLGLPWDSSRRAVADRPPGSRVHVRRYSP